VRNIKRWMIALIALAGFNGALPQAQAQTGSSTPNHNDSLDIASVDLHANAYSDGVTSP
jgi:hypothetical protein